MDEGTVTNPSVTPGKGTNSMLVFAAASAHRSNRSKGYHDGRLSFSIDVLLPNPEYTGGCTATFRSSAAP